MSQPLSRRIFLALTGAALATPSLSWAAADAEEDDVPVLLDHIILGCNDLDLAMELVEQNTGVRPAIGGAVHPPDIAAIAKLLRDNKIAFQGPDDGSRKRPDGRVLNWKTINLADDRHGMLPFFIEWGTDSVHPSKDAPKGYHLDYFTVVAADPAEMSQLFQHIGVDAPVERSDRDRLRAHITGPKGELGLSS